MLIICRKVEEKYSECIFVNSFWKKYIYEIPYSFHKFQDTVDEFIKLFFLYIETWRRKTKGIYCYASQENPVIKFTAELSKTQINSLFRKWQD